jgi:hypothetical protein
MRTIIIGGPAAGEVAYPIGRHHKDRWRVAPYRPLELRTALIADGAVPEAVPMEVVDYEVREFRASGQSIFVLALPEWSDAEVMGELLSVYQQAKKR